MKQIISPTLLFLLLAISQLSYSQSCECTNCGVVAPANTVTDFEFEVMGATNNDLTDPDQGVCGVYIEFAPDHIWTLEMTLIAPSGQRLTLIGPPNNGGFFSGSLTWGITFLPCGEPVDPDPGFTPQWNNNQSWTIGSAYQGSYYPFAGCLEDFMAGDVNGIWTLSVNNTSFFNVATIHDFKLIFCDQDGLDCFPCDANAGSLKLIDDVVACPGDPSLALSLRPEYGSDPEPDPAEYGYTFIVAQNDTIIDYDSAPDLQGYASGRYTICGMSYLLEDASGIPSPDGSLTVSEVVDDFSALFPPFCGAITEDCLNVWIIELDTTYLADTICVDGVYDYGGERFDSTGTYIVELTSTNSACDSIVSLNLTVLDSIQVTVYDSICRGEEYCVGSRCFVVDGTYQVPLTSTQAPFCDSLVTLHLTVKESPVAVRSDTICQGDSVVIRGDVFRTTGLHFSFPDPNIPCDTLIELKLLVVDPVFSARNDTLCAGDSLWLEGQFFNTTGVYQIDYASSFGCDSTVRLDLLVLDSIITPVQDTLCAGDTWWIGGDPYFETNDYDIWLRSVRDCDSLVQLDLYVRDTISSFISDSLCMGEVLSVGPFDLDSTDIYEIILTASTGCDSIVTVDLTVFDTVRIRLDTVICRGETLRIGSREFNDTGIYEVGLTSSNGCDSTVVVNLNVLDPIAIIDPVDLLACDNNPVRLDASGSSGQNLVYHWVDMDNGGAGIVAGADSSVAFVNLAGTYQLVLTDTLDGHACTVSTFVGVGGNLDAPQVFTFDDTLSCNDTSLFLNAVVLAGGLQFSWTGPGGFTANILQPEINTPGDYILVTTGSNNCRDTSTINVFGDFALPIITAAALDTLDCITPLVPLAGTSQANDDQYLWTGPGTFSSVLPNTLAGIPGSYNFLVTGSNGCTADTTVQVLIDTLPPQAQVLGDTLSCNKTIGQLTSNFSTTMVTYDWTGPGGFSSNLASPLVFLPGDYDLVLTGPNGCTTDYTAEVFADTLAPDLTLQTDTLNCIDFFAELMVSSSATIVSYSWTGPNSFTNATPNPVVATPGTYYINIEAINGCVAMDSLVVPLDTISPTVLATGNTLNCQTTMVQILGASSTVGATYAWTGPGAFSSDQTNPVVTAPGDYILTVTAPNGCTAVDTAVVMQDGDLPGATAIGDTLDCINGSGQLLGNSATPGVSYSWTGPGTFSSIQQNPMVSIPGTYILTVLGPNGCESQATVDLLDDRIDPDLLVQTDTLTCLEDSVQIIALSLTSGVGYEWTGPGAFTSNLPNPFVRIPGAYEIRVTGPNACISIDTAWVIADQDAPDIVALGDTITCNRDSIDLLANSNTPGVSYSWTGPGGFTSMVQTPRVGQAGLYELTITAPNACTAMATAVVEEGKIEPGAMAVGDTLTCVQDMVTLLGSSPTSNVSYSWTGPGTYTSNLQNPEVSTPGRYYLEVEGANGCISIDSAEVETSIDLPGALAESPDTINCAIAMVTLQGSSSTVGVDYFWIGPNLFTSIDQNPTVAEAGEYVLVVTGPNSCRSTDTIQVIADTLTPPVVATGDTLDCQSMQAQLMGFSPLPGVTYAWTGPGGFNSNLPNPTTTEIGEYILTVTAPNSCTATDTVIVLEDVARPDAFALGDTLTCTRDTIQLLGSSTTLGVTYHWDGPGGITSDDQNPRIGFPGQYILIVEAPNGCTAQDTILVEEDIDPPGALATADTLDCQNNPAGLFASSPSTDVGYFWTGPSSFTSNLQNPLVSIGGLYILEVSGANGCSSLDSVLLVTDLDLPGATALVEDTLNCSQIEVTLQGSSPSSDVDFFWIGPNAFTSIDQNPTVNVAGTYQLFVSGSNSCVSMATIEVMLDTLHPDAFALGDTLNCQDSSVPLQGSSTTPGVTYEWMGPGGFTANVSNPVVTEAGLYELTVRAPNGCTALDTAWVWEDENLPGANAVADTFDCVRDTVQLMASSPTAGVSYFWLGPGGFSSGQQNPRVDRDGEYLLFVTGSNGCESQFTLQVIRDTLTPIVSLLADTLTCQTDSVQIMTSATGNNLSYNWSGPGAFSSNLATPFVSQTGVYQLTLTAGNSCTSEASITIEEDRLLPDLSSQTDTLTCAQDSVNLLAFSSTPGVSYAWTGPGGFSAAEANPRIGIAGDYYLVVTALNGCSSLDTLNVPIDTLQPMVQATGGFLGCMGNGLQLTSNVLPSDASISWEGPGAWTSNDPNPIVFVEGEYYLTATGQNGCVARDTAQVVEDLNLPGANILGDTLTCESDSIQLLGSSPSTVISYAWTGPGGFSSSQQNPMIGGPGEYILVVTGTNNCESQESITILQDTLAPIITLSSDTLGCEQDSVQLMVLSSNNIATYTWTGPNAYISNSPMPFVQAAGSYHLSVVGENFCTNTDSLWVADNSLYPEAIAQGDTLTCTTDTIQLLGNSSTPGVSYEWNGVGGFSSADQNPRIAIPGTYILSVWTAKNCVSNDTIIIVEDIALPGALAVGDTLDCQSGTLMLLGSSPTAGVSFEWMGPGGFSSNLPSPMISSAGEYYLVVTGNNGCQSRDTAEVLEDLALPGASILGDTLSCTQDSIDLLGNSPTAGVSYTWSGPGFSSNLQNPRIGEAGTYFLTVTSANACESIAQLEVLVDTLAPDAMAVGDTLDCTGAPLQLQAFSSTPDINYSWEGPGGFSSNLPDPFVSDLGSYMLRVEGSNGCFSLDTTQVIERIILPGAMALGDTLVCGLDSIQLLGNSPTPGVSYTWTGPNGYTSAMQNPFAEQEGQYILSVIDSEGCESLDTTMIVVDTLAPNLQVFHDTLNCRDTMLNLQWSTNTTGLSLEWMGPGGFLSNLPNPEVMMPGTYILQATGQNQCITSDTAIIEQDILAPDALALGDTLDCARDSIDLLGQTTTSPATFAWVGPAGFSSNAQSPRIGRPGIYFLSVMASNFCTTLDTLEIIEDLALPEAMALGDTLNCAVDTAQLQAFSSTANVSFSWTGPGGFNSNQSMPMTELPGWYYLTVQGENACEAIDSALVETDFILPDVLAFGDTLDCGEPIGQLLGTSATPQVSYSWTGPGGFSATQAQPMVSDPGTYVLLVTAPNFCTATDTVEVLEDVALPGAMAEGDTINCANATVQLLASSPTAGVTYAWAGPNTYTSNQQNPIVNNGGAYTLTVSALNGCQSLTIVQVTVDTLTPDLLLVNDTLDCNTGQAQIFTQSSVTGGQYEWTGPLGFSSNIANPIVVDSGWYQVILTAPNFCRDSAQVLVIPETNLPTAEAGTAELLNCEVFMVELDASASSGEANLLYEWEDANGIPLGNTAMIDVDAVGWYYVQVSNPSNACSDLDSVLVEIDTLSPTAFINPIGGLSLTCNTTSIVLDATGSSGPGSLEFEWWRDNSPVSTEPNYEINTPGQYILIATNMENGCRDSVEVAIIENNDLPVVLIAPPAILNCRQSEQELDATASSMGSDFQYLWNGPSVLTGANTLTPRVDEAGVYQLLIINNTTGCRDSASVRIDADFVYPIAEAGEGGILDCETENLWLDGSGSSQGTDFLYQWLGPGVVEGANELEARVNQAGPYWFEVLDNTNGCASRDSVLVALGNIGPQIAEITLQEPPCFGDADGAIIIDTVRGGLGPFLYALDGEALVTWPAFDRLPAGEYLLTIQDVEGCELDTLIDLSEPGPVAVQLGPDTTIQLGESVEIEGLVQSDRDFEIQWEENRFLVCDTCLVQEISPTRTVTVQLSIEDIEGCQAQDRQTIFVEEGSLVYVPSAFSPNGDGENDFLEIFTSNGVQKINSFLIFDRWGEVVHEARDFLPGDPAGNWNGSFKGQPMNPAVFVFMAEVELVGGKKRIFDGSITLVR